METPPQFYNIRDLVLLPELNPRAQLCEETISRYMESFDALPPVSIQEGTGVLVDGFHRVEAATRLGAEAIPVRMLDIPDEELHLYAGLGNCGHGRALNRAERNRFIVRLIEQYHWPGDKVARVIGVSPSSVSLALREHQYNQALTERLGEEVQVINSAHVQALYRVGPEQRAQLLDAVADLVAHRALCMIVGYSGARHEGAAGPAQIVQGPPWHFRFAGSLSQLRNLPI